MRMLRESSRGSMPTTRSCGGHLIRVWYFIPTILTSPNQWFVKYAKRLSAQLADSKLFFTHEDINKSYDILFILSYHKIVPEKNLIKNRHNIVIHASNLQQGKGWAPLFWQILEGKNEIIFTSFFTFISLC